MICRIYLRSLMSAPARRCSCARRRETYIAQLFKTNNCYANCSTAPHMQTKKSVMSLLRHSGRRSSGKAIVGRAVPCLWLKRHQPEQIRQGPVPCAR